MHRHNILILLFSFILMVSCNKDEASGENAASFLGDYIGKTYYYSTLTEITHENSLIRVYKGTSTYNFKFYNGIKEITGVRMEQKNDSTWASTDTTGTINITIVRDTLNINYSLSDATWTVQNALKK